MLRRGYQLYKLFQSRKQIKYRLTWFILIYHKLRDWNNLYNLVKLLTADDKVQAIETGGESYGRLVYIIVSQPVGRVPLAGLDGRLVRMSSPENNVNNDWYITKLYITARIHFLEKEEHCFIMVRVQILTKWSCRKLRITFRPALG
jgi:hypothetical protein